MTDAHTRHEEWRCLEPDVLVDLHALLDHDPERALEHLRSCEDCRGTLATLSSVYRAHAPAPDAVAREQALAESVLASLPGLGPGAESTGLGTTTPRFRRLGLLTSVGAAAGAGFFGALLMGSGAPGDVGPVAALMAAAVTALVPLVEARKPASLVSGRG